MGEEMGLAQSSMQGQGAQMPGIQEVVMMIKQGATPEELVQMGVPQELVMAAMEIINKEATAVPQEGLAGMSLKTGM